MIFEKFELWTFLATARSGGEIIMKFESQKNTNKRRETEKSEDSTNYDSS